VVFLTNRNSHHIQALIEAKLIMQKKGKELAILRPDNPSITIIDKIAKERMCLLRARDPSDRSPMLLCEFAHCKYSKPLQESVESLVAEPKSAMENVKASMQDGYCAHFTALQAFQRADVIICDYSYMFEPNILSLFIAKSQAQLGSLDLIIDEAHNLPDRVRDINCREIDEKTLKHAQRALSDAREYAEADPEMNSRIGLAQSFLRNSLASSIKDLAASITSRDEVRIEGAALSIFQKDAISSFGLLGASIAGDEPLSHILAEICDFARTESMKKTTGGKIDIEGLSGLSSMASFLSIAERAAAGEREFGVFAKASEDKSLFRIRALLFDPSFASEKVFNEVHSAVLMSGTLLGKQGICQLLGIDDSRAFRPDDFAYESPFDPERQRLRICTWASSRQRERSLPMRLKAMAAIIDEAAKACAPHSLAIFYPSYDYLRMLKDELVLSGFHHETEIRGEKHGAAEERKAKLESRTFDDKPIALHAVIGGAYSEGMDFRNNPFKLIVLAGFPFPKPDAAHEAYEGYLRQKFENPRAASYLASLLPACIKSAQAMGRGIRKSEDWCYCLLIDDRFSMYLDYFQPSHKEKARVLEGDGKKMIYDDISRFITEMDAKGQMQ
jgi:DNA excision repair protein ERCC-2